METFRQRYEQYREALAREGFLFRSGRKQRLELEEIDARYADIAQGEQIEPLQRELEAATFEEEREGWRRLWLAVQGHVLGARVRSLARELREREAAQTGRVDADERTLFGWQSALGAEADAGRRRRIQDALDRGLDELNDLREALWMQSGELLAKSGYATPRAWAEANHPTVDYDLWARSASRLLEATDSVYRDRLREALGRVGVHPEDAMRADAPRVARLHEFDRFFPADRSVACLDFAIEGMGLRMSESPGVVVDDAPRPRKHPRASCIGVRTPGEVYVLLSPHGGLDDYETLFHEAGHAFHFAYTSAALPVERRRLMDPALTETWAFLLHYRFADRDWIAESPVAQRAEDFTRAVRFRKLALLRRYASKILFEIELNALQSGADPRPLAERYAEELSGGTGYRYRPCGYLADTDRDFYSVDYLRAWCLEVQIAEHLRARFGHRFWKQRGAGELLKELWNTGSTYSADGIAEQLGLGAIDIEPLVAECLEP
jgi:hypothetical protein